MVDFINSISSDGTSSIGDFLENYCGEIDFGFSSTIGLRVSGYNAFYFDGGYSVDRDLFDKNVDFTVYPGGVSVFMTYGGKIGAGISVPFASDVGVYACR